MFGHGAVKSKPTHRQRNNIGKEDAEQAADGGDNHGLSQKLHEDIPGSRAQSLFHTNLARTLRHRDQHDVHQPDAADTQGHCADHPKQALQHGRHDAELRELFLRVEHKYRPRIIGLEVMRQGKSVFDGLGHLVVIEPDRVEPYPIQIVRILDYVHGSEGDVDDTIVVAVALLHARLEYAHYLERNSIDADGLSDGVHPRKKSVARFRSEHGNEAVLHHVGIVEKTSLRNVKIPNVLNAGIEAHCGKSKRTVAVLHAGIFRRHTHDVAAQRNVVAHQFDVIVGEAHLHARLVTASLLRGASRKNADGRGAKTLEDVGDSQRKAVAVSQKEDDSGNPPRHSRHRQQCTAQIVAHG